MMTNDERPWTTFDPTDPSTQPPGTAEVEAEFADGSIGAVSYDNKTGVSSVIGFTTVPKDGRIVRWRKRP